MHPAGVAGRKTGVRPFCARRPMFNGWKPSTSLLISIAWRTRSSSRPLGSGSCTRMPCTFGSALSSATFFSNSSWEISSGSSTWKDSMPTFAQRFCFILTYMAEAGSPPTNTVASPGTDLPAATRSATFSLISSWI